MSDQCRDILQAIGRRLDDARDQSDADLEDADLDYDGGLDDAAPHLEGNDDEDNPEGADDDV